MLLRPPDKAGAWYESAPAALREELNACIAQAETLYGTPKILPTQTPVAAVVPHAGLFFSGAVAATAYTLLRAAHKKIDTFVLFGACHRTHLRAPALWPKGAWQTPLGNIEIDEDLAAQFLKNELAQDNPAAHTGDNALELQTPFIKHLFPEARIVPIAMSFFPASAQIGEQTSRIARENGRENKNGDDKTIVAIASTDLTHYGASFNLTPAGTGDSALKWLQENDTRFLATLTTLDLPNIVPTATHDQSACGAGAAAAAAGWAHDRGGKQGRILARTNSHEVAPRGKAEHIVGYAAVSFEA